MQPARRAPTPVWQPHATLGSGSRDSTTFVPAGYSGRNAHADTDAHRARSHAATPAPAAASFAFVADPLLGGTRQAALPAVTRPSATRAALGAEAAVHPPRVAPDRTPTPAAASPPTAPAAPTAPAPPCPSLPCAACEARSRQDAQAAERQLAAQAHLATAEQARAATLARQQQLDTAVLQALDRTAATPPPWQADDLASLALHLAMQLVRGELQHGPHAIDRLARGALQLLDDARGDAVVDLHPDDLALAQDAGRHWPRHPALRADATLSRGSVRVRVGAAEVEDLLEQRLQALADALLAPADPVPAADPGPLPDTAP